MARSESESGTVMEFLAPGYGYTLEYQARLLDRQTPFQRLEVLQTRLFGNVLRLDGALQCSERDEFFYHEPLVHMAAFSHAAPRSVLIIGGGDGGAAEEVLKHPTVEEVVLAEVDGEVIEAASVHLHSVHRGLLDGADNRLSIEIVDGSAYLASCGRRFDLLILDLTDPGEISGSLYSIDFYRQCLQHLTSQGVMTLHVASPWAQAGRVRRTFANLAAAGFRAAPYLTSIPMSGGSWVMGLCRPMSADDPPPYQRQLSGIPLAYYSPAMHNAMLVQPPYLSSLLSNASSD